VVFHDVSADLVKARFAAQLLTEERGADAVAVADRLLAVQAQDLRSARLTIRARTNGLSAADAHFRPFAYVRGRAVATWRMRRAIVEIDVPFSRLSRADLLALRTDAADVRRFISGPAIVH